MKYRLLKNSDLRELYRLTGPDVKSTHTLLMVKCLLSSGVWEIESSHELKGYNGTKRNLEARVRQYAREGLWPEKINIGIGVYKNGNLIQVLEAVHLGLYQE